ncbi:MAG: hypothetical protein LBM01_00620 [Christensenellaceae bacterium]|jgi:NRPS condensation-like uncharacterized protein|nr:hypothetical protein [Christensenellaceae bacterium]
MAKAWYKIDNAGIIYPLTFKKNDTSFFRLSAVLKKDVNPEILLKATGAALIRFPMFKVKMKSGFFWPYLEENDAEIKITKESPYLHSLHFRREQNGYLFSVMHYGKRVSAQFFHGLCDGHGGLEFFKTVLYYYFTLSGEKISNNGEILTNEVERLFEDDKDNFFLNYNKKVSAQLADEKAFRLKGNFYKNGFQSIFEATCDEASLKAAAKKYDATVGLYLSALLVYHTYLLFYKDRFAKKQFPIRLFLPVDLRKYFDSKTLRNFSLFIRTTHRFETALTFEDVIEELRGQFTEELSKEKLEARIKQNIGFQTILPVRLLPLALKKFIVKIAFKFINSNASTITLSNLGKISLPKEFNDLVEKLEFTIPACKVAPIVASSACFNGKVTITLTSIYISRAFQKQVFNQLRNDGVSFYIESNDVEAGL